MTTLDRLYDSRTNAPDDRTFAVRRFGLLMALCVVVMGVLIVVHIAVGTLDFTAREIVLALFNEAEEELHRQVVWGLRLPRALVALVAGAMLGLSGAILQTVTRNPLAAPGLIGVTQGGVLAIVIYIVFASRVLDFGFVSDAGLVLPLMALVGGLGAAVLTYALSYSRGSDPVRLVLVGVLVGAMCTAFTSVLLLSAQDDDVHRIIRWTVGSTSGRVWLHWHTLWPVALIALPLGTLSAGFANVLQLGDGVARGLGIRIETVRMLLLLVAALLTAGAVAIVGSVGFIGLIGPHMARRVVGDDARRLFPMSAVLSAILLISADIVARTTSIGWLSTVFGLGVPDGAGVPVGAVTAMLGAPFFLWLLLRSGSEL
ncbi:MAG: FecCD family ABC transporter permease [Spirochaetota bacterium]